MNKKWKKNIKTKKELREKILQVFFKNIGFKYILF